MKNREKIQGKLDFIKDCLNKLNILKKYTEKEFFAGFERLYAAEHLIQITIQSLLDVSSFIVASEKFRSPGSSVDVIEVLYENKLIDIKQRDLYQKIIRFRNIVVHFYNGVNENMLYGLLQNNLCELEKFYKHLLKILKKARLS